MDHDALIRQAQTWLEMLENEAHWAHNPADRKTAEHHAEILRGLLNPPKPASYVYGVKSTFKKNSATYRTHTFDSEKQAIEMCEKMQKAEDSATLPTDPIYLQYSLIRRTYGKDWEEYTVEDLGF